VIQGKQTARLADSIAYVSRRIAETPCRKISETLFRYYPAKKGRTTIRDFDGDLAISLDRSSYINSAIYWAGHHSLLSVRFLREFLRPEMTLADIGANIGEITLLAAKRLSRGEVLAFEPMPQIYQRLCHNVGLNRFANVKTFNVGLYDEGGSLPMFAKNDNPYGTTNEGVTSLFHSGDDRQEAVVPLRRFDDVAQEAGLARLDVMKIDVEGAEWMVLQGAAQSIKKFRPVIIVEISESNFKRAGYAAKDMVAYLRGLDYHVQSLENGGGVLSLECDAVCFPCERKQ
jgi:FkbM family methyltransferase